MTTPETIRAYHTAGYRNTAGMLRAKARLARLERVARARLSKALETLETLEFATVAAKESARWRELAFRCYVARRTGWFNPAPIVPAVSYPSLGPGDVREVETRRAAVSVLARYERVYFFGI